MDEEKKEKKVFFVTPSEGDESINDGQQRLPQINQPTTVQVKRQKRLSIVWPIVIVAAGVLIYYLVLLNLNSQPKPLTKKKESSNPDRFIAERAESICLKLASIGPKVPGSHANEVETVQFLRNEIAKIVAATNRKLYTIDVDVQEASDSFPIDDYTTVYRGIQNVVVKLEPLKGAVEAVLLNSHFDTVPTSNGGGDDVLSVSVMLEVLRTLATAKKSTTKYTVLFLFNGAEENDFHGSHAFIKHHKWANRTRAFVNLDNAGTEGQEMLFQSTGHNWMLNRYSSAVPHPFAIVTAQEMFDAKLIPSDTDFRVLRDFGNDLPGLDLAVVRNGYVYHTKYDRAELISRATYQAVGDNVLALTRALANAKELKQNKQQCDDDDKSNMIYFDYLGWFMVKYSMTAALAINCTVFVIAIIVILVSIKSFGTKSGRSHFLEFVLITFVQLLTQLIAGGIVFALAIVYDLSGRSMSWYSNHWFVAGIYLCPLFFLLGSGPALYIAIKNRYGRSSAKSATSATQSYIVQMFLHAQCLLFSVVGLLLTIQMWKSAFIFVLPVSFATVTSLLNVCFKLCHHDQRWVIAHLIGQILPFAFFAYFGLYAMDVFIPIQGRSGPTGNPEIMIAAFSILVGLMQASLIVPTFSLCRRPMLIMSGFLIVFSIFLIVMATPVGFPFREKTSAQRFWIFHTERTYRKLNGSIRKSETGYFMLGMDRHQNNLIEDYVPLKKAKSTSKECSELFCGLPLYSTRMIEDMTTSHWVPAAAPKFNKKSTIKLVATEPIATSQKRFHFEVTGTDHMSIYLSPVAGVELAHWNVSSTITKNDYKWKGRDTYYVTLAYSLDDSPYKFYVDVEQIKGKNVPTPALDVVINGHYIHYDELQTSEFKKFLKTFPKFAHVTAWMSSYDGWQF